jgi:hypothetical protein
VGVQLAPGYCSIEWRQDPNDRYSFTVSGDTDVIGDELLGKYSADAWANHDKPFTDYPINLFSC